jgi:hypothetical protein
VTIVLGLVTSLLIFRLYAWIVQRVEQLVNMRVIRPNIASLRHIRNNTAERTLVEFSLRTAHDFSIGDATRQLINTGLIVPIRNESELILMLGHEKTRLQAIEGLVERGGGQAIISLSALLDKDGISDLEYKSAIRSLVKLVKLQNAQSYDRSQLFNQLTRILNDSYAKYDKRLEAYRGLLVMGYNAIPPERNPLGFLFGPKRQSQHNSRPVWVSKEFLAMIISLILVGLIASYLLLNR